MNSIGDTILLVEDYDDDVFAFKWTLKRAGVTCPLQVVVDGRQAIDYLGGAGPYGDRDSFPLPFAVFLDLKLPFLNGFEVLTWIRGRQAPADLTVIILTGSDEERDHQRAEQLGAFAYLVKPVSPESLLNVFWALDPAMTAHECVPSTRALI